MEVECPKEDLQVIDEHDAQILLAVQSYSERCRMLNERQDLLRWGGSENEGCQVLVWMEDLKKNVDAVVHYKGALPPFDGIMFGVEIVVSVFLKLLYPLINIEFVCNVCYVFLLCHLERICF